MPLIVIETVDIDSCTNSSVINLDAAGLVFQEEFCNRLQYSKAETTLDNVLTVFLKKRIFKAVSTNQLNLIRNADIGQNFASSREQVLRAFSL